MSNWGSEIEDTAVMAVVTCIVIAFLVGVLLAWGLPKLWIWIKPFIHAATAG